MEGTSLQRKRRCNNRDFNPAKTKTKVYGIPSLIDRTAANKSRRRNASTMNLKIGTKIAAYPSAAIYILKLVF